MPFVAPKVFPAEIPTPVHPCAPFAQFDPDRPPLDEGRRRILGANRLPETICLPPLVEAATLPPEAATRVRETARRLVTAMRDKGRLSPVEGLMQEYALSTAEGVALMCLAEALLRVPDTPTRDALIRDKIATGDWQAHLGGSASMFVNASTWGLLVTGKVVGRKALGSGHLAGALGGLLARCGEPVVRAGVTFAMRMMGEQFVLGETITDALDKARSRVAEGYAHSYDMLGEAAMTEADAACYLRAYEQAIHAIGAAATGKGPYVDAGISIKLSALHSRYRRARMDRVFAELLPRVRGLALLAKHYDIGLNIDAEEAERLMPSLDLLGRLSRDPELAGWNGLGVVVQAYAKRCPFVIDHLIDMARQSGRRLMIRLVKGAYWDSEIKAAQVEGLEGFPVYTRKVYSDIAYAACARKLLAAPDAVFPQFATHNAQSIATVLEMAGDDFTVGQYEFQCLHGMGEALYDEVVGPKKLNRPCRIYAPVGSYETLLAYLVRRLLENGANSSFVNRIADETISIDDLTRDPVEVARSIEPLGAPHGAIPLPTDLYGGERRNAKGLDVTDDLDLADLETAFRRSVVRSWRAVPMLGTHTVETGPSQPVRNPADLRDVVGQWSPASREVVEEAFEQAAGAAASWAMVPVSERAERLEKAADLFEAHMAELVGLTMREAGKSVRNGIAEVREAVDFLRYYAAEAAGSMGAAHRPLGPVVCISPWNFPLAIFTGQIAAALLAGNVVLAKPAEETPLIAAEAVTLLRSAGIPDAALQLLPGDGAVGAQLVSHPRVRAVLFTGSTEVSRLIARDLAQRTLPDGRPIPLIAETGGQNALIADSSALTEQVVADVVASAFDSAGQRCSALRILCLQEDVADRTLEMLRGAMTDLRVGAPDRLATDVGPVISKDAQARILAHIDTQRAKGRPVHQAALAAEAGHGFFVPPTLIELDSLDDLTEEVFGPVLHVYRYRGDRFEAVLDEVNRLGFGLTFGLHTRIDARVETVCRAMAVGNIYVNRNIVGAIVGVQPFGGRGLSGTGPKAGGPLYLRRLMADKPLACGLETRPRPPRALSLYLEWLTAHGLGNEAGVLAVYGSETPLDLTVELKGPVGERNTYRLDPRGTVLLAPETAVGLRQQLAAVLATGNQALVLEREDLRQALSSLPADLATRITWTDTVPDTPPDAALIEGEPGRVRMLTIALAALDGPLVPVQSASSVAVAGAEPAYRLDQLLHETAVSVNTAAAGGNASLMAVV